jgi:hypothetical protein
MMDFHPLIGTLAGYRLLPVVRLENPGDAPAFGGGVEILLKIYATCLDGGRGVLRQRVQAALGHRPADGQNLAAQVP